MLAHSARQLPGIAHQPTNSHRLLCVRRWRCQKAARPAPTPACYWDHPDQPGSQGCQSKALEPSKAHRYPARPATLPQFRAKAKRLTCPLTSSFRDLLPYRQALNSLFSSFPTPFSTIPSPKNPPSIPLDCSTDPRLLPNRHRTFRQHHAD